MATRKKKDDPLAGRDPTSQLYRAVRRYVESLGGNIAVIGGINTIEWPGAPAGKFTIGVECLGNGRKNLPQ